jgi:hypothetical protein
VDALRWVLIALGAGFFVANARLLLDYVRFYRRRRGAILTWPGVQPPYFGMGLAIGVMLGVIVFYKVLVSHQQAFGEAMMFLYYAYLAPLSRRIGRGFYQDGIWVESDFIRYDAVSGIKWRESEHSVALVLISRLKQSARVLQVPVEHYAAARRLLRDKIGEHAIHFTGTGLDLGQHDEREEA